MTAVGAFRFRSAVAVTVVLAGLAFLGGCSSGSDSPDVSESIRLYGSSDISELTRDAAVGASMDSLPSGAAFGSPRPVGVMPNCSVLVYDSESDTGRRLWLVEYSGKSYRVLAVEGEGPGEIRTVVDAVDAGDGTVYILDPINARILQLDTVGQVVASVGGVRPAGRYGLVALEGGGVALSALSSDASELVSGYHVYFPGRGDSAWIDPLGQHEHDAPPLAEGLFPVTHIRLLPGGDEVVGNSEAFVLRYFRRGGGVDSTVVNGVDVVRGAKERARLQLRYDALYDRMRKIGAPAERVEVPSRRLAFERLLLSPDDYLWASVITSTVPPSDSITVTKGILAMPIPAVDSPVMSFFRFDRHGRLDLVVRLPEPVLDVAVGPHCIWATVEGVDGARYLRRYDWVQVSAGSN